jgi:hypothetical protein
VRIDDNKLIMNDENMELLIKELAALEKDLNRNTTLKKEAISWWVRKVFPYIFDKFSTINNKFLRFYNACSYKICVGEKKYNIDQVIDYVDFILDLPTDKQEKNNFDIPTKQWQYKNISTFYLCCDFQQLKQNNSFKYSTQIAISFDAFNYYIADYPSFYYEFLSDERVDTLFNVFAQQHIAAISVPSPLFDFTKPA